MSPLWFIGSLTLLVVIAQIPALHALLVWERADILAGQWWRIVTGNLTHTNAIHLMMNIAGLLVIFFLHRRYYSDRSLVPMVWLMMAAIGLVMFFSPYSWYAGLSGVLHGLFVWGVVKDIQNKVPLGWAMLAGVFIKLGYEAYNGGDSMTAALIQAGVAYQAHWTGAIVGLLFALLFRGPIKKPD